MHRCPVHVGRIKPKAQCAECRPPKKYGAMPFGYCALRVLIDDVRNPIDDLDNPIDALWKSIDGFRNPVDDVRNPIDAFRKPIDHLRNPVDDVRCPNDELRNPSLVGRIKPQAQCAECNRYGNSCGAMPFGYCALRVLAPYFADAG